MVPPSWPPRPILWLDNSFKSLFLLVYLKLFNGLEIRIKLKSYAFLYQSTFFSNFEANCTKNKKNVLATRLRIKSCNYQSSGSQSCVIRCILFRKHCFRFADHDYSKQMFRTQGYRYTEYDFLKTLGGVIFRQVKIMFRVRKTTQRNYVPSSNLCKLNKMLQ